MYIRIAFSIELRLRVSRSLRSLANYIAIEKYCSSVTGIALVPAALALIHCNRLAIFLSIDVIRYVYVIARVGVKFGINFTSVKLSGNKIARGEAECYLPLNLTRVKFVPEISRLTVLLKINTIASLLFI